ncbi:hypothetical protein FRX31_029995 [Thalictrum thalictroides]|uniref:Protein NUCLEAR FUSION DEFECTIVE 6, chloroplastic/mitochondrial-like n=1 Tax=Thalictrum thalictroides TaxID=46969 RepID=A0A7J6V5R9_THATH|nr:hypothetical protein FRX31_029995 [Thalictrum thalictroides]
MASSTIRSAFRSSSFRSAASKFATQSKPKANPSSPFCLPKQNPLSSRIFRSPVELSCCVDSLMPFHTATSSALLTSMIAVSRRSSWLLEGLDETS